MKYFIYSVIKSLSSIRVSLNTIIKPSIFGEFLFSAYHFTGASAVHGYLFLLHYTTNAALTIL